MSNRGVATVARAEKSKMVFAPLDPLEAPGTTAEHTNCSPGSPCIVVQQVHRLA